MNLEGTKLTQKTEEIYSLFAPVEGFNYVYYGKIRNGKTYAATADIIELLKRGEIVYANWNINFDGYDERKSFWVVLIKFLAGKKYFYNFSSENFHYLDLNDPNFITDINKLVGVHLFIDEGQWIFNSHARTDDPEKRRLILEGGHYCRALYVITQRPTNILKDVRSQVHMWYKCEKVLHWGKLIRFVRWEIEDTKDDVPVDPEDSEKKPPSKAYWANRRIYNAYNTHARRSADAVTPEPQFDVYEYTFFEKLFLLGRLVLPDRLFSGRKRLEPRRPNKTTQNKASFKLSDIKRVEE